MERAGGGERRRAREQRRPSLRGFVGTLVYRRRRGLRRADDTGGFHYIDHYPPRLFAAVLALMLLCTVDAALTLHILERGGSELNPVMQALLEAGPRVFFVAKYAATALCAAVLVAHARLRLFRRLAVGQVLGGLVLAYFALVNYELLLIARIGSLSG